jgi:hypothetical protein
VPGTSAVVRLGKPDRNELEVLLDLALYVVNMGTIDVKSVAVSALVSLSRRVGRLRKEYGERSIFDALGEVDRPTIRDVTIALYGKPCRYPKTDCRFRNRDGKECAILKDQAEKTIEDLAARRILRRRNAVEPYYEAPAPPWASEPNRFLSRIWWPRYPGLWARAIVESPAAFRRRGILLGRMLSRV